MFKDKINFIIKILITSDFFIFFALGLSAPIFAVFILDNISGSDLEVIGLATTFYWLSRILSVVPLSRMMDKMRGEEDEFYFMFVGSVFMSVIPALFIFATLPWHVYALQILSGFAHSMAIPAWRILFTNHIDRRLIGYEWSVEDVSVGIATAGSAAFGAFIAKVYGFNVLFLLISILGIIGSCVLLFLFKEKKIFAESVKRLEENLKTKTITKIDTIK
ncbi:MAG: MFS transporter [Candidatus Paceibacterota bacterium]